MIRICKHYIPWNLAFLVMAESLLVFGSVYIGSIIKRFLDVENTRAWALIMSSTPQLERIQGLLCLNRQQRAVLSLCTADEWKELCKDQGLVDTIIDSRHQRSLWYRN